MEEKSLQITNHDFLIYKDGNDDIKVGVMLINNDLWLTQDLIAFKSVVCFLIGIGATKKSKILEINPREKISSVAR